MPVVIIMMGVFFNLRDAMGGNGILLGTTGGYGILLDSYGILLRSYGNVVDPWEAMGGYGTLGDTRGSLRDKKHTPRYKPSTSSSATELLVLVVILLGLY